MDQFDLNKWEEFEEHVARLYRDRADKKKATGKHVSKYLFRGQPDCEWRLETTLERYRGLLTLKQYFHAVSNTLAKVETYTGGRWHIPTPEKYAERIDAEIQIFPGKWMDEYEYLAYLRHQGFPSPLLDWSRSPYVAAYFAFRDVPSKATKVSIYAYCEYTDGQKSGSSDRAFISELGPNVRSHPRHFQQQSAYTFCTVYRDGDHWYTCHEDAFAEKRTDQDSLSKFNIPASQRSIALEKLQMQYNITAFSLFGSEESLMEALAIEQIFLEANRA